MEGLSLAHIHICYVSNLWYLMYMEHANILLHTQSSSASTTLATPSLLPPLQSPSSPSLSSSVYPPPHR